jgi:hypothetical protein
MGGSQRSNAPVMPERATTVMVSVLIVILVAVVQERVRKRDLRAGLLVRPLA